MKNFFRRIFKIASRKRSPNASGLQAEMQRQLLRGIQQTQDVEYDCEDVYRLMDQYVEMRRRGEDTAALMPLVEHHLRMCGDCREEVDALLRMMDAGSPG
jgi:hypothetical protein